MVQIKLEKTDEKHLLLTIHLKDDVITPSSLRNFHFAEMRRTWTPPSIKVEKREWDSILIKGFDIKAVTLTAEGKYSVQVKGRKDARLLGFLLSISSAPRVLRHEKGAFIFTTKIMEVLVPSELERPQWTAKVTACPESNRSTKRPK
jgi:hypothetical protein